MSPKALKQVKGRMERATEAVDRLRAAGTNLDIAERAWSEFLLSASTVYSKLEEGSKTSGKSNGWFGRKKSERKNDPLLSYIHHARNSDEHSIEEVTERQGGGVGFNLPSGPYAFTVESVSPDGTAQIKNHLPGGILPTVHPHPARLRVLTVLDKRYGDSFPPPKQHLGTDLATDEPADLAEIALAYLVRLVSEAESLPST